MDLAIVCTGGLRPIKVWPGVHTHLHAWATLGGCVGLGWVAGALRQCGLLGRMWCGAHACARMGCAWARPLSAMCGWGGWPPCGCPSTLTWGGTGALAAAVVLKNFASVWGGFCVLGVAGYLQGVGDGCTVDVGVRAGTAVALLGSCCCTHHGAEGGVSSGLRRSNGRVGQQHVRRACVHVPLRARKLWLA